MTALDTIFEPLLILVLPLKLNFAHFLAVKASVHNLIINFALACLHRLVEIQGRLRGQERAFSELLHHCLLSLLLIALFECLSPLLSPIPHLLLLVIVDLKQWFVKVLI